MKYNLNREKSNFKVKNQGNFEKEKQKDSKRKRSKKEKKKTNNAKPRSALSCQTTDEAGRLTESDSGL